MSAPTDDSPLAGEGFPPPGSGRAAHDPHEPPGRAMNYPSGGPTANRPYSQSLGSGENPADGGNAPSSARRAAGVLAPQTGNSLPGSLPVTPHAHASCLNCGEPVPLHYCPRCGQEHKEAADMALRPLLGELAAEWVAWDSKLLRTLAALLLLPGRLSAEYNAGRRARYLSPLRLYLVVSALFFLVVSSHGVKLNPGIHNGGSGKITGTVNLGGQTLDMAKLPATVAAFDAEQRANPLPQPMRTIARQIVKARGNGQTFVQSLVAQFFDDAPKALFVLLPAFALLLKLTYRRQRRFYVEHLIFALHAHSFTFLLLAGLVLWPDKWNRDDAAQTVVFVLIGVYLLAALHRVYGQGWGKTFVKFCWLGLNYLFLLTFTLLLALGAAFLTA